MGKSIKLTFLGDVMCKMTMFDEYSTGDNKYDFSPVFAGMKNHFDSSDFVFANMETPISYDNSDLTRERYEFNSPYEFAKAAHEAGIDFAATANNHCLDRGIKGLDSTVKSLDEIGFYHTGVFSDKNKAPLIIDINGTKIGVMSYTYGTNAYKNNNYLDKNNYWRVNLFRCQELTNKISRYLYVNRSTNFFLHVIYYIEKKLGMKRATRPVGERKEKDEPFKSLLIKDLNEMKSKNPDLIVMYMHAGGQYNSEPIEYTKNLTKFLLDNGVNIIAGSHEHVVHGGDFSKIRQNKIAAYSLGNFDGVAGVYDDPFDKMAEYSIEWNVYVRQEGGISTVDKTTFCVLKTIPTGKHTGGLMTVPLYDLISSENDEDNKNTLEEDMLKIASIFAGKEITDIESEYFLAGNN